MNERRPRRRSAPGLRQQLFEGDPHDFVPDYAADVLWAAGWRKRPSRQTLLDALFEPNQYADNERVFAGRALAQAQAEAITDAILALLDGPTETGGK